MDGPQSGDQQDYKAAEIEAMQAMLEARGLEREPDMEMPMPSSPLLDSRSGFSGYPRGAS